MNIGLLQAGDPADFIRVEDLVNFSVTHTYKTANWLLKMAVRKSKRKIRIDQPVRLRENGCRLPFRH